MSRGSQVIRQWRILRMLEHARRPLTLDAIWDRLEEGAPHLKTVARDLAMLQEAGFPLDQVDQGWRLSGPLDLWQVPVRPTEALALWLAEDLLEAVKGTPFGEPLVNLRQRLTAMMTPAGRQYAEDLRRTMVATSDATADLEAHKATIGAVEQAIHHQQCLEIVYQKPGAEPRSRIVEPYSTWYRNGRVYVICFCRRVSDIRTLAVQRIHSATVLDETFEPDPDFDAAAFARRGFGAFHGASYRFIIEFEAPVAHMLRELQYHHSQKAIELDDGRIRVFFERAGLPEVAAWVCGFGGNARPVAPSELVEEVRTRHLSALVALGDGQMRSGPDLSTP